MMNFQPTIWAGVSGREYEFTIFPWPAVLPSYGGIYIFGRSEMSVVPALLGQNGSTVMRTIYIGQTSDLSERFDHHHAMPRIRAAGPTHIMVHYRSDETARFMIEADLCRRWRPTANAA